VKTRISLASKW